MLARDKAPSLVVLYSFLTLFILTCATGPVFAQDCENWDDTLKFLGQTQAASPQRSLIDGNLAFTCGDQLLVLDLTYPDDPLEIGSWTLPAAVADLMLVGDFLYLACGATGIQVVDVGDPTMPQPVATFAPGAEIVGLASLLDLNQVAVATDGTLYVLEPLPAANPPADLTCVGQVTGPLPASHLATLGSLAYATGPDGITIFNLVPTNHPSVETTFYAAAPGTELYEIEFGSIDIIGNRAVVSSQQCHICNDSMSAYPCPVPYVVILDLSNPLAPAYSAWQPIDGYWKGSYPGSVKFFEGGVVAAYEDQIVFLEDPTLEIQARIITPDADVLHATGQDGLLLAARGTGGLQLYDTTWPRYINPLLIFGYDPFYTSGYGCLECDDSFQLFYGISYSGWAWSWSALLYDARDPLSPVTVYETGDSGDMEIYSGIDFKGHHGEYAVMEKWHMVGSSWYAIKSGSPGALGLWSGYNDESQPRGWGGRSDVLWFLSGESRLASLDLTAFPDRVELGSVQTSGFGLHVGDQVACMDILSPTTALMGLDLADPANPVLGGEVSVPSRPDQVLIQGTQVVAICDDQILVFDFSDPHSPAQTGACTAALVVDNLIWDGELAVALYDEVGFQVFQLNPTGELTAMTDVFPAPGCYPKAALSGHLFYQGNHEVGIDLYTLANPANPQYVGRANSGAPRCMNVQSEFLVTSGHVFPLECTDPVPVFLSFFRLQPTDHGVNIVWAASGLSGNFLLEASTATATWAVAISADPLGGFTALDQSPQLAGGGEVTYRLYLVNEDGPTLLKEQTITLPSPNHQLALKGVTPNPFNPLTKVQFSLAVAGQIDLAVFDLRGNRVRTLSAEVWPVGDHEIDFDGKDDQGRSLPSGSYFLRLETGDSIRTTRATLLR